MAANRFTIPQFDIDLLNWSNNVNARNDARARQRQQDWNTVYSQAAALGNTIRAEKEAEKARKEAAEQAALQRKFQAQEAEKARTFQAAQNAANRQAQMDYNNTLKDIERQKQEKKDYDAAQILYGDLISKENPNEADVIRINQLREKYPTIDEYNTGKVVPTPFANAGEQVKGSIWDDVQNRKAENANKNMEFAKFKASLPTTFDKKHPKQATIDSIDATNFSPEQKKELYDMVLATEDQKTKTNKAIQGAVASAAGKKTTEKIEQSDAEKKVIDKINKGELLTPEEGEIAQDLHYHWDKSVKNWVKTNP
jgi:hypothetical protein